MTAEDTDVLSGTLAALTHRDDVIAGEIGSGAVRYGAPRLLGNGLSDEP